MSTVETDTSTSTLTSDRLYAEGCQALRHYSSCVMQMRTVTIAQGFVIISATIYLIRDGRLNLAWPLPFIGLLFTWVLHSLQANYWKHFDSVLEYVEGMENPAHWSDGSSDSSKGPWSAYAKNRRAKFRKKGYRLRVRHGPFLVMMAALAAALGYALVVPR